MISLRLQFLLFVGSILFSGMLLNMIRRYRIELKYTLLWLAIMFTVTLCSVFPSIVIFTSKLMGIELPVNALFLVSIFGILLILFSLTIAVSRFTNKIKELSQELGIVKTELILLKSKEESKDISLENQKKFKED